MKKKSFSKIKKPRGSSVYFIKRVNGPIDTRYEWKYVSFYWFLKKIQDLLPYTNRSQEHIDAIIYSNGRFNGGGGENYKAYWI